MTGRTGDVIGRLGPVGRLAVGKVSGAAMRGVCMHAMARTVDLTSDDVTAPAPEELGHTLAPRGPWVGECGLVAGRDGSLCAGVA